MRKKKTVTDMTVLHYAHGCSESGFKTFTETLKRNHKAFL